MRTCVQYLSCVYKRRQLTQNHSNIYFILFSSKQKIRHDNIFDNIILMCLLRVFSYFLPYNSYIFYHYFIIPFCTAVKPDSQSNELSLCVLTISYSLFHILLFIFMLELAPMRRCILAIL